MPIDNRRRAVEPVAVACMHLVVGRAVLDFPTSTRAAPSRLVTIHTDVRGPLADRFHSRFPMQVSGQVWQNAVVPVLEDPAYQVMATNLVPVVEGAPTTKVEITQNPVLAAMFHHAEWSELLELYIGALVQSYQAAGYLPTDEEMGLVAAPEIQGDPQAPGEPLARPDGPDPLEYEQFDC